jgi:SET domain-containing protein
MTSEIVIVKRSEIGLGLFALIDIPKGTKIIQYTGERIRKDDTERHKGRYLFTLNDKWTIDGKSRTNLARYANHSCRPNAETITTVNKIWIVAKRKIKAGEEITYNYGKTYFNQFIKPNGCKCVKCKSVKLQPVTSKC